MTESTMFVRTTPILFVLLVRPSSFDGWSFMLIGIVLGDTERLLSALLSLCCSLLHDDTPLSTCKIFDAGQFSN